MNLFSGRLLTLSALVLLAAPGAEAQSAKLLEAVRLLHPEARALALTELQQCQQSKCDRIRSLSLLAGVLTLSDGDPPGAVALLASQPPPQLLGAIHAFHLGQAYFYARRPRDAARQFEAALLTTPRWLEMRLRARLGEAYLAAGDGLAAAPHLEKAAPALGLPELYFQRAQARRAVGNLDGERADYEWLALRHPAHPLGASALSWLKADKRKPWRPTLDDVLTRARGLLEDSGPEQALRELDAPEHTALVRGASAQMRVVQLRAMVLFAQGKEAEGLTLLDAVIKKGTPSLAADAMILKARKALKGRDNTDARKLMALVAERYPKEGTLEEALFFVGWLAMQSADYPGAIAAFEVYEKKYQRSRRRDDVMWFKALTFSKLNDYAAARTTLESMIKLFPKSLLVPQAQYWSVRWSQLQAPAPDVQARGYEQIVRTFPGSFYAVLSSERLREMGKTPPALFEVRPKLMEVPLPESLKFAVALSRTGLLQEAADEIEQRLASVRNGEQALVLGSALIHLGEYGAAHRIAARFLWGQGYAVKEPRALALLYPKAYADTLRTVSKDRELDPYFMWAIMRRESQFRSNVVSSANARGLMQLIPPTATAVAKEMSLPPPEPGDLFSPELNIRLSGWYMSALFKRFNHPVLSAAAYNAGPKAALRWMEERGTVPLDVFVEDIPFKETRAYIKQVIADQHIYRALYAPEEPRLPLQLALPKPATAGVEY